MVINSVDQPALLLAALALVAVVGPDAVSPAAAGRLGAAPPPFHSAECHPAVLVGGWLWIVCSDINQERHKAKETIRCAAMTV